MPTDDDSSPITTAIDIATNGDHETVWMSDTDARKDARQWVTAQLEAGSKPTGKDIGARYGRTDRWGRNQIKAATPGTDGTEPATEQVPERKAPAVVPQRRNTERSVKAVPEHPPFRSEPAEPERNTERGTESVERETERPGHRNGTRKEERNTGSGTEAATVLPTRIADRSAAKIAEQDAEAERDIQRQLGVLDVKERNDQRNAERRRQRDVERSARKERKRNAIAERRAKRNARLAAAVSYIGTNAVALYSLGIYGMAFFVAFYGQVNVASGRGWSMWIAGGMALFLEGTALSMALTSSQLRLKGERAVIPQVLTWASAGFAASINFFAHWREDVILAAVLGASSLVAITVWEVRSAAKHRKALRAEGMIPEVPVRFGWRRWFRYPIATFRAWSLDVRTRVGTEAADLIRQDTDQQDQKRDKRAQDKLFRPRRSRKLFKK